LSEVKGQSNESGFSNYIIGDGQGFDKAQEDRQGIALVASGKRYWL